MKAIICLVVGGAAAYAAGTVHNNPFAGFCGAAAILSLIAAVIYLVEDF